MKRMLLALCVLCMIFAATTLSYAGTSGITNGVLSQERVINLPQDQGKWYLSIVGDASNQQYQKILVWFKKDADLYKLRRQVHYIPVTTNTATYQTRYKMNVADLPTVRLQNSEGVVIYEAAGNNLPFTPEGLYGAMANNVAKAQRCPILPWRRNHVCPGPCPTPTPEPVPEPDLDPEPGPIDDGGAPDVDVTPLSTLPPLWLMLATLIVSAGVGTFTQWRETYAEK